MRVLRPPIVRAAFWIAGAGVISVFLALYHGVRPDLSIKLADITFLTQVLAALATGVTAAVAAFYLSLPDRPPSWALLPVPSAVLWASVLGYGCLANWIRLGPDGLINTETLRCLGTIALVSGPLLLILPAMLRHAAIFRGGSTSLCGALAVAAIAAAAVSVIHDIEATIIVLMLNVGIVALFLMLGRLVGPRALALAHATLGMQPRTDSERSAP